MNQEGISNLANVFLALSDRTRLRLIDLMRDGEVSVGFLADSLNESQPKTSRHLAYLRNSGLVRTRRDGKWIYYGLEKPADPAAENILAATLISLRISNGGAGGVFINQTGDGAAHARSLERPDTSSETYMFDEEDEELPVYLL
jgi:DNA-binding transcriptional ArsR family regulator